MRLAHHHALRSLVRIAAAFVLAFAAISPAVWGSPFAAATAPTYYVSPGGSDRNDGLSPDTAWATFGMVSAGAIPSRSTILARAGGTWTESITVAVDHLTFGVYGDGARPKIVAPDGQAAFLAVGQAGTSLEGWEFTGSSRNADPKLGLFYLAGGDFVVRDIVAHGVDGRLATVVGGRGLIEGSEFYDHDGTGGDAALLVYNFTGDGTPDPNDLTIARSNFIHDTKYRGIGTWGTNILIEGNRLNRWSTAYTPGSATAAPSGIYVGSKYSGIVTVRDNELAGSGVEWRGIWVDWGPDDHVVVENNRIDNAYSCFQVERTDNTIFQGNTCSHISRTGVVWGGGNGNDASRGGVIANNTFVGSPPAYWHAWIKVNEGSTVEIRDNTTTA